MEKELIPYVVEKGFTHIELMPMTQYPFDGSWGYQATGFTAVDSRYGSIQAFKGFINACHQHGIGVIVDYVLVHFASDNFGLIEFDGTKLYEYFDPQKTYSQWGSPQFDLGKFVTRSLLFSGIHLFLDEFHIDGIRIDAVSNMVYWDGNPYKGENHGGLSFLKQLNHFVHTNYPTVMMIAEDSTAFPGVTRSVNEGGLGFDYKWDMGWMNDTLKYYGLDDVYKYYEHHKLTFSMHYFFSERFLLPLSHDEVVHGKGTILNKMFGSYDTKFALLRNLYVYQFTHPGKKLNFMGNELGSFDEWDEKKALPWFFLEYAKHRAISHLFIDLNKLYRTHPALYEGDYDGQTFRWIMADNAFDSVFIFQRKVNNSTLVMVFNMKGNYYNEYVIAGLEEGEYEEVLNSTNQKYEGFQQTNEGTLVVQDKKLTIRLGSYAAIILRKR
jgi:1,4-alpha-glucan branching enzyme